MNKCLKNPYSKGLQQRIPSKESTLSQNLCNFLDGFPIKVYAVPAHVKM